MKKCLQIPLLLILLVVIFIGLFLYFLSLQYESSYVSFSEFSQESIIIKGFSRKSNMQNRFPDLKFSEGDKITYKSVIEFLDNNTSKVVYSYVRNFSNIKDFDNDFIRNEKGVIIVLDYSKNISKIEEKDNIITLFFKGKSLDLSLKYKTEYKYYDKNGTLEKNRELTSLLRKIKRKRLHFIRSL